MKLSTNLITKLLGGDKFDSHAIETAEEYCRLLLDANQKINLVSRSRDTAEEIERQILLSLSVLPRIRDGGSHRWLDIGSGGGFPAIPLAIFRPQDSFDLVESVSKKAFFLERTAERLSLGNVRVFNQRAEDFLHEPLPEVERYSMVSIKAVAGWKEAFSWGEAALRPGGTLVTFKPLAVRIEELAGEKNPPLELIETFFIKNILPEVTTRIMMFKKPA